MADHANVRPMTGEAPRDTEPRAQRLTVERSARYFTLGDLGTGTEEIWILLHGYGQLAAAFLSSARALARSFRFLVAPEALSRFYLEGHQTVGACWMTREDRLQEIEDYLRYLDQLLQEIFSRLDGSAPTVHVLGFSQGAATAGRWACRGRRPVDQLVLWGELLAPELEGDALARLRTMRLSLVCGSRDRFVSVERLAEQRARLERWEIPYEEYSFQGGHRLDDETLKRVAEAQPG